MKPLEHQVESAHALVTPAETTLKKHGGFDDLLNNLLEPILKVADPEIELVVQGYEVVNKREYPSQAALRDIDCVMISGSFVRLPDLSAFR